MEATATSPRSMTSRDSFPLLSDPASSSSVEQAPELQIEYQMPSFEKYRRMRAARLKVQNSPWARFWRKLHSISYSAVRLAWKWTLRDWFDARFFVKKSKGTPACEIAALRFIRRNTTIPVPFVWGSFTWRRSHFILMQRIPGTNLEVVWDDYSEQQKASICQQLKKWMDELRKLETPYGRQVCSAVGGPMWDARLIFLGVAGPFVDEFHMNCQLGYPGGRALRDDEPASLKTPFHRALEGTHRMVFTHGDLVPRNILVQQGVITAIIDWESSGWFPEHWEYVKAHHALRDWLRESWAPYIKTFLTPCDEEKEADDYMAAVLFPGPNHNITPEMWMETREGYLKLRTA